MSKISLPGITPSREITNKIIKACKLSPNNELAVQVERYIHRMDCVVQYFRYYHNDINEKVIYDHNAKVRRFLKDTKGKISNVTALTLHTKKGSVTFECNGLTNPLFRKLLSIPKPDMTWSGDHQAQFEYLNSDEIDFPLSEFPVASKDQLFRKLLEEAIPLGQFMHSRNYRPLPIKRVVIASINNYFPDIIDTQNADAIKKAFQQHFTPQVKKGNLTPPK